MFRTVESKNEEEDLISNSESTLHCLGKSGGERERDRERGPGKYFQGSSFFSFVWEKKVKAGKPLDLTLPEIELGQEKVSNRTFAETL